MFARFHFEGPSRFSLRTIIAGLRDFAIAAVCISIVLGLALPWPREKLHRTPAAELLGA